MTDIRTILHPTDFSEESEDAFHFACSLARDFGAKLVVLYVMPFGTVQVVAFSQLGSLDESSNIRESFMKELKKIRSPDGSVAVEHRMEDGDEAKGILRVAHEIDADLIVMATHGRSGLARALMGSVAEYVVRRAECPVLTMSHPLHGPHAKSSTKSAAAVRAAPGH